MGFKGSKVQILSSRPAHKENYPKGISGSWFPFSRCIPQKTPLPAYLQRRSSRPSDPFPFVLLKPRIGIFQRFLHRADNGSRWNPQSLCKPNKGFHPDPGLSLFETPQPRIVNARLLSQSIAAHAKPFAKRRYNQFHDDFLFYRCPLPYEIYSAFTLHDVTYCYLLFLLFSCVQKHLLPPHQDLERALRYSTGLHFCVLVPLLQHTFYVDLPFPPTSLERCPVHPFPPSPPHQTASKYYRLPCCIPACLPP